MFERCVGMLIREAVLRGEFERLRGAGKKIDLTTYSDTPAQSRLSYSALASAGVVPREVELLREISGLETAGDAAETVNDQLRLRRRVQQLRLDLNLRLERDRR